MGKCSLWTPEETALLMELYPTTSTREIAELLGRTPKSIRLMAMKLNLRKEKHWWTPEELQYLEDKWGKLSVGAIAKNLGRSECTIKARVVILGLGGFLDAGKYITLHQLSLLVRRGEKTLKRLGLPVKRKKVVNCSFQVVDIKDFWKWAEQNRDEVDFSLIRPHSLGREPAWVAAQREKDIMKAKNNRNGKPWTEEEDRLLVEYIKQYRYTAEEIAQRMKRSVNAIHVRTDVLCLSDRPLPAIKSPVWWTEEEENLLKQLRREGHSFEYIADKIGRTPRSVTEKCYKLFGTVVPEKIRSQ